MARYSAFLGRRVEVHYRAGDILLPASGTFVADSGRSIFLQQELTQHGQQKNFRWEIPYQYIVRLEAAKDPAASGGSDTPAPMASGRLKATQSPWTEEARSSTSAGANASGDTPPPILPLRNPPKIA